MTKKISNEDKALFREATSGVSPHKSEPRLQTQRKPISPRPRQRERDEQQVLVDMLSDPVDLADLEIADELHFSRNGIQHKVLKQLRRGEMRVEAELDLHGYTKVEARLAIIEFLQDCHLHFFRCVRIIHGKGYGSVSNRPILKQYVNHWLRQRSDVLAFSSARPVDGGTGAIYVLLKKA